MRPLPVVAGFVLMLLGVGWALQGAYFLPSSFMRGPEWVGIGAVVALVGFAIALSGLRPKRARTRTW